MKKSILLAAAALLMASGAKAETEYLSILLNNGTTKKVAVSDIKEMSFTTEDEPAPSFAEAYAGSYEGVNTVAVAGQSYSAKIKYEITANEDGTVDLALPQYDLTNTVMGNLTLGAYSIRGIAYDEEKQAFYRAYGNDGLSMHFYAIQPGSETPSFDKDYNFSATSDITLKKAEDGTITVTNSFQLGAMPFPIVATFTNNQ